MDKKYLTLFENLAQATAVSAETVMEYNQQKGDEKGVETATSMRNDYQALADKIKEAADGYTMTRADAAKLCVGAMIMANQLQDKINALKKAITGYQSDVIPKLQKIVDETKTDEEAAEQASINFILKEDE